MKHRDPTAEERLSALFQPDTLLPVQYFDRLRRRAEYDGERRLMIAVLEDAVDVYRKQAAAHDLRGRTMFEDAESWIEATDRTWLFSFENICDVLDLDAACIRRGLREWKRRMRDGQRRIVVTGPVAVADPPATLRHASGD